MIYGRLPTSEELKKYINTLAGLRELPGALRDILERIPATAHPMDVVRTGCSALGVSSIIYLYFKLNKWPDNGA